MSEALLNGQRLQSALAFSRGLHYGDGVFRTLLRWQAQFLDWDAHMARLAVDCAQLHLQTPPLESLRDDAERLCADHATAVLKVLCIRKSEGRGYAARAGDCDVLLLRSAAPQHPGIFWTQGIAAVRSPVTLSSQPALAGAKHLNRLEQVLASRDWPEGAGEAIMCDQAQRPICGTRSNLFWVRKGVLYTPDLASCGVAGVMRGRLLRIAAGLQIETRVVLAAWTELEQADEAFVSNSLIGIWPLHTLGLRNWAAPGVLTSQLAQRLNHPQLSA